jgi:uncharacterized protein
MTPYLKADESGVLLNIRLVPGASQNRITGFVTDPSGKISVKISVTTVPEKGKANAALVKLLSKLLNYPKSKMEIVSGKLDRDKTVQILGEPSLLEEELVRNVDFVLRDKGK